MFSYQFYKVAHIVGLILVMSAIGATALHAINGGTRLTNRARGLVAALHGTGVVVLLVAGFGMLARLGVLAGKQPGAGALSGWIIAKLVEGNGDRSRVLYVLKSRGMAHSHEIRDFELSVSGLTLNAVHHNEGRRP